MQTKRASGILMPLSSLPGGYGIMIDDVMAGLQALLVMWLLQLVGFWGV